MLPRRGVLAAGSIVFALEASTVNLSRPFGFRPARIWDSLGFAILLFSFAYVALQMVFANERRLSPLKMNSPSPASCSSPFFPPQLPNFATCASRGV